MPPRTTGMAWRGLWIGLGGPTGRMVGQMRAPANEFVDVCPPSILALGPASRVGDSRASGWTTTAAASRTRAADLALARSTASAERSREQPPDVVGSKPAMTVGDAFVDLVDVAGRRGSVR